MFEFSTPRKTTMTKPTLDSLLRRWDLFVGNHRRPRRPRQLAALGLLVKDDEQRGLVDLHRLSLVVLFDEDIGRRLPALRLAGYGASRIEHGVQFGGEESARFYIDFGIEPFAGACGLQLDARRTELFQLALQLHRQLHRVGQIRPNRVRLQPQLPSLWAGFAPADAASLSGEGPELTELSQKFDLPMDVLLRKFEREHQGLRCFPLEWVSSHTGRALQVFADLEGFPRRQVFRLTAMPDSLLGFQGACAFDFYSSRMRSRHQRRLLARETTHAADATLAI
jgi:hypothetical protein